ncbi:outer membrane beta-barrel protein [Microbulbifer sp. 2201CG32-9]|uniref:outer membrane beta-barrel protein n=1 Tax=unclassified Microbulbifer TaxID=2619833 RepID=UPI00345BE0D3
MRNFVMGAAALALSLTSAAAMAQQGGAYWGVTAGIMDIDLGNADSPFNVGLRGGFTSPSGWGFEAEYTNSLVSGEADLFRGPADVDIQTLAGYGTYRSHGDIYFKGRLGLLFEDVSIGSASDNDTGISLGGGVGFNISPNTNLELEYTVIEQDVGFWSGSMTLSF